MRDLGIRLYHTHTYIRSESGGTRWKVELTSGLGFGCSYGEIMRIINQAKLRS
jgi:hypothetical protein